METISGTLPLGVEQAGETHREFTLRERLMRDEIHAYGVPGAVENDALFGVAVLTGQVLSLGSIPKEEITTDLLLDLRPDDFKALAEARDALADRLRGRTDGAGPADGPGPDEGGV